MTNNLVIATGTPRTAQNDGNTDLTATFGPQLWCGTFGASYGTGVPTLPQGTDVVSKNASTVLANPTDTSLTGLADASTRYALAPGSPAKGAGEPNTVAPDDALGNPRSATAPSIGAVE